jgi:hypothetical protein
MYLIKRTFIPESLGISLSFSLSLFILRGKERERIKEGGKRGKAYIQFSLFHPNKQIETEEQRARG